MNYLRCFSALFSVFFGCSPVAASYCEHNAQAGGMYCMMTVATGTPDMHQRSEIMDTEYVDYCRIDEFDGAEVCILVAELQRPLDVEVAFIRAAGGGWLISVSTYFEQLEEFSETLEAKVDGGPVILFQGAGGSRGYQGEDPIIIVKQTFAVSKRILEGLAAAQNQVWFRFNQKDGSHRDLKMKASSFSLLSLFIAEASSAYGGVAPND